MLNRDNLDRSIKDYKIWKEQMVCLLESQGLLAFVNVDHIPPRKESVDEHNRWRRTDRMIKGWILGSINGTDVLDTVVELKNSREVWLELENIFKAESSVNASVTAGMDLRKHSELYKAALKGCCWKARKIVADDVALNLVQKYKDLAKFCDVDGDYVLQVMARMKSVFPSGESFSWWQNWIYSCLPPKQLDLRTNIFDIEDPSFGCIPQQNFNWLQKIAFVVPGAKKIHDKKVKHQQALDLVKKISKKLENSNSSAYERAIITAARNGIHEVVEVITELFPRAIYVKEPETGGYIFHVAARERFENVFNLLKCMNNKRQFFYDSVDYSGNNFMHLCAELAPHHKLNLISGAALQMQRELQWFKEMENFVNPSRRTWRNKAGKTPHMLFTEKHQHLKSQGEKWMKDTATSCTIAAALIATVMFAAAFTVPGGVHSDSGVPIYLKETTFIVFAIADSVSMFTSSTSLLMFLSILTSRYAERDFLYVLPRRLCIGLLTLFTSISFMMVAFSAATYIHNTEGKISTVSRTNGCIVLLASGIICVIAIPTSYSCYALHIWAKHFQKE